MLFCVHRAAQCQAHFMHTPAQNGTKSGAIPRLAFTVNCSKKRNPCRYHQNRNVAGAERLTM